MTRSVLIAVTHLLGVGHLSRAASLGRGLAASGHRVTLVTGGRPAPTVDTSPLRTVQLPPVHCRGLDFTTLLGDDGRPIGEEVGRARIAALLAALEAAAPDIVLTETYPFGRRQLAAEFAALVAAARARAVRPLVLASIRDILNPPSRLTRVGEANEVLARGFDGVLVHGDPSIAPLGASWPDGDGLSDVLRYTGYVCDDPGPPPASGGARSGVLVSGGGSDASLPLFEAAIAAAPLCGHAWRILVGHGVTEVDFSSLRERAPPNVAVERARADFKSLLRTAAVSVSQAGYNTVVDLAGAATPSVLVPFERGREAEQRLRAECFAGKGLATLLPEDALSPRALAGAVEAALAGGRPDAALDLGGVGGSLAAIASAIVRRSEVDAAWSALDAALDRAARRHGRVELWWRDDDAVAATPALDRLLALSARLGLPVALAVIPALAGQDLVVRLADEPLATVLVHGHAHRDHAPPGARKQELGHRPPGDVATELSASLARIAALFGARALPVLVPPWNRIDRDLVPLLPSLGFAGLSCAGRRQPTATPGLVVANTHLDPVAWRRGRGLADEAALLVALAADLDAMAADGPEPIGLLTHHLVHDPWVWDFVERFLVRLSARPDTAFEDAGNVFGVGSIAKDCVEPRRLSE